MPGILIKREETQSRVTQGEGNHATNQGREWSGASTSQGMPRVANKYQKLDEARVNSSLQVLEGAWPYLHLAFGLLPSRAVRQ